MIKKYTIFIIKHQSNKDLYVFQLYMQKFQLKGERFGGGGGYFGRGRRGGFRGGLSRQGDTCYRCGGTGHWAADCKGRGNTPFYGLNFLTVIC